MRIILDNQDEEQFNRIITIQQKVSELNEIISMFIDGLKALGFTEEEIFDILRPMDTEEE